MEQAARSHPNREVVWREEGGGLARYTYGDFAVRVPQGSDYEMVVHVKGFADQTRALDAKTGVSEARIVFRMEPDVGGKK